MLMRWINFIDYQAIWFALVIGASRGATGLAMLAGLIFVVWQVATADDKAGDIRRVLIALVLGMVVDGVPSWLGWWHYATPTPAFPPGGAPLWILTLWMCFSTTIDRSLRVLRSRLWLASLVGAIGGPLAYLAAVHGWAAIQLGVSTAAFVVWLAVSWAIAMPLLCLGRVSPVSSPINRLPQ